MKSELFPFQKKAIKELREKADAAIKFYNYTHAPQVISLQAPTGSGKTIMMAAFIEEVLFGNEQFSEQPDAIFVWLSDSPALNTQSKEKIDLKADKIRFDQCVMINDESFDMEVLEDGHIYFLNTQKIGKGGNLTKHSDTRHNTIWETLENTAKDKSDRLYFIIDEAHRGMQGKAAGTATSIMQRFLKGYEYTENSVTRKMRPMPVVIGVSATAERFNTLVGNTTSTLHKCIVTANEVRASGLLKDRIIIMYSENQEKNNELAVLQAATDEWKQKCDHWYQYCYEQHYAHVNPVFVIQVKAGSGKNISDSNLDDIIAKIEERLNIKFKENEVVHTFGSIGTLTLNGLSVPHIEPSDITDDRRIKVVLFKENLSTGWDCPRAETMMSFRRAEDVTYITQLLGRMIRTPMQSHIKVDDYLNDVRLFLPYFNKDSVDEVKRALQETEGGDIPVEVDGDDVEQPKYVPWTVHPKQNKKQNNPIPGQASLFDNPTEDTADTPATNSVSKNEQTANNAHGSNQGENAIDNNQKENTSTVEVNKPTPQQTPTQIFPLKKEEPASDVQKPVVTQTTIPGVVIDREAITKFINDRAYPTYLIRTVKIHSYLKSLLDLSTLLTQTGIYVYAKDETISDVLDMMRAHIDTLHANGTYDELSKKVLSFKLSARVIDAFGEDMPETTLYDLMTLSDSDLDRQTRAAETKLGGFGFVNAYGQMYYDPDDPNSYKIDAILFAADDNCMAKLNTYAEKKFHEFNDKYRVLLVNKPDKFKKAYSDIIADSDKVTKHNFSLPEIINVKVQDDGKEYDNHLFANEDGIAKIKLNNWEEGVLDEESKRSDFVCWIRNASRGSWSLCIPYQMWVETKPMYPDFIVVRANPQLDYIIDILEPHGPQYKDNLAKAKGLAKYAEEEPRIGRIQLIREGKNAAGKNQFVRLDLAKGAIRNKVLQAVTDNDLDLIFSTDGEFNN